jgi:hypothetical protein
MKTLIEFLFHNVNGISTSDAVHKEFKLNMVRLQAYVTAVCESSANWQNFALQDKWERNLQCNFTNLHFSHALCIKGFQAKLQCRGMSMCCNSRLGSRLISKGGNVELGHWSGLGFAEHRDVMYLSSPPTF